MCARSFLFVPVVGLLACAADETAILLEVCTDLAPAQADSLRLVVSSTAGSADKTYVLDEIGMPFEISLRPGPAVRGSIEITALLSLGETPVVSRVVRTAFVDGSDTDLRIFLDRACIDVFCPAELTCTRKDCVPPGPGDADCVGTSGPGLDAAVEPGRDSGPEPDSGGDLDAGLDSGLPCPGCACDSDSDCGPAEVCLDRACATQCSFDGDCPYGDRCIDGFCGCPPGWTDCWGDCVDLLSDSDNCGSCGWACDIGQDCEGGACEFL